jgi:hypothetical protein
MATPTRIIHCTLNGKKLAYTDATEFVVQVGKGTKGSYKTVYSTTGALGAAVTVYQGIRADGDNKKRLVAVGFNKPLLTRVKANKKD